MKFTHLLVAATVSHLAAAQAPIACGVGLPPCPQSAPCCTQYGACGSGPSCLGGCDPRTSFSPNSCMPMPMCQNVQTNFTNYASKVANVDTYLGNVSQADWVYSGFIADYQDTMLMAMPKNSGGSVLSSTRFMWYGKTSVTMKTSHLAGVVTAFILFSNVQDECDYEFVGADVLTAQTNYYFQGVLDWHHSSNITTTDTFENFHTYTVDWTPDSVTWSIDGVVGRVLNKNDTFNATSGKYEFPQTPARVQLSIWPAGNATNAPGTIAWSGGLIDWNSPDIQQQGYYYAALQSASIECYPLPDGVASVPNANAYDFTDGTNWYQDGVSLVNKQLQLFDVQGNGMNPGNSSSSSSSSSTSSSSSSTKSGKSSASGSSSVTGSSGSSNSQATSSASSTNQGFVQNMSKTKSSNEGFVYGVSGYMVALAGLAFGLL